MEGSKVRNSNTALKNEIKEIRMSNSIAYNSSGSTITECLNRYFGCSYESFTRVVWTIKDGLGVWFAQLAKDVNGRLVSTSSMGWINILSSDENTFFQDHPDNKRMERSIETKTISNWLIFMHNPGEDYIFKGIYRYVGIGEKGFIFKRISKSYDEGSAVYAENEDETEQKPENLKALQIRKLYRLASENKNEKPVSRMVSGTEYERNVYVSEFAKKIADGVCQLCGKPAPFIKLNGEPFLETHHITWLANGGADTIENTIALCPNCHRKMHEVNDGYDVSKLRQRNAELLEIMKKNCQEKGKTNY